MVVEGTRRTLFWIYDLVLVVVVVVVVVGNGELSLLWWDVQDVAGLWM